MDAWRTAIVDARDGHIRIRGYDVSALMTGRTFTDTIFLLHQGRLPTPAERALLDAILTGVADHGSGAPSCAAARLAASGNRQSISSAVAAGILAVGDDHGGAGLGCMEMIAEGSRAGRGRVALDRGRGAAHGRTGARTRQADSGLRPSRPFDRSAHRHSLRPGPFRRHRRRRRRVRDGRRTRGGGDRQAASDQHRRRPRRGAARHGFCAGVRTVRLPDRPHGRAHGGSRGGADAREADAHPHPGRVRRQAPRAMDSQS